MVQVKKRLGSDVKNVPPIEEKIYNRDLSYAVVGRKKKLRSINDFAIVK